MKRIVLFFIVVFLCIGVVYPKHLYIEYAGDPLSEKEKQRIERMMEYQVDFYSIFGIGDSLRVKLTVFNSRDDGILYLDSIGKGKNIPLHNTSAVYMPSRDESVILGVKDRKKVIPLICHQLSHYLTREIMDYQPAWLMEGLAEYFEHCEIGRKGISHSMSSYETGRMRTMYMLGEINLKKFVDTGKYLFLKKQMTDEQSANILSHALVTFFIEKVPRQVLCDFIALQQDNHDLSNVSGKIATAYPGGFEAFDSDFRKFCEDYE